MKRTTSLRLLAIALCLLGAAAFAMDPEHLDEMPDIARVLADVKGQDRADTLARQAGALRQLADIVARMAGERVEKKKLTADETRLYQAYWAESNRLASELLDGIDRSNDAGVRAYMQANENLRVYGTRIDYRNELMERYFSDGFIAQFRGERAAATERARAENRPPPAPPKPGFELFDKRWNSLTPDEKKREILIWSVLASLLALALVSLLALPFDIDPGNIERLRSGLRRYKVRFRTGRLVDYSTEVSGGAIIERVNQGGGQWSEKITSSSTFLDETLTLVDDNGSVTFNVRSDQSGYGGGRRTEESGYFFGREGLEFTAVWITTRFRKKFVGPLLFYCAEPRLKITGTFSSKAIARARGSQRWSYWVALVLGFAVGAETDIPLGYIVGAIVVAVAWFLLRGFITDRSERRFEAVQIPRLFEHVEALQRDSAGKG